MNVIRWLIALLILTHHAHCQVRMDSVFVQGHYRTFYFHEAAQKTNKSSLVFILHGSGGNGEQMVKPAASLQAVAKQEHLFLVYPNGYKRYWNECRKQAQTEANKQDIDEQAYFAAMQHYFAQNYRVDDKRFFAIGLSGGGHMAYKLAMTMPDQCKAISAIVANLPDTTNLDCAEARKPVAVMITNSTEDDINPYNGGKIILSGSYWGDVRSTDRTFRYWAALAGYEQKPSVEELPDSDPTNKQTITRYTFKQKNKPEVALLRVNGGVHAFPKDLDIFLESWAFFKREIEREAKTRR